MNRRLVSHRLVFRLLLIVVLFSALLPQTPLWALRHAQNAPDGQDAPDSIARQIPLTGVVQIAANGDFTCILTSKGGVKCWGFNNQGQLGDGTQIDRLTPVDVSGLSSGVKAVAAGAIHACALLTSGGIKCWGNNSGGQIGDGTSGTNRFTPVAVSGISNAIAISTGEYHSCAVLTGGGLKCWGSNNEGQIGDGTSGSSRLVPVAVSGISNAVAVSTSRFNSCAILATGGLKCWGGNDNGQVGDGTEDTNRLTPTDVSGLSSDVKAVTLGQVHTCAMLTQGNVKCWGSAGSLGDGNDPPTQSNLPIDVDGLGPRGDGAPIGVSAIAAGDAHTCVALTSGGAKCWGKNLNGQIGDGTYGSSEDRLTPTDVTGLKDAIAVAAGYSHTCALLNSGGVQCWGANDRGQLGDNSYLAERALPADVTVPATCFVLNLNHSGGGSNPAPTPSQSSGCPARSYLAGTAIALVATPNSGSYVKSWTGSNNNGSHDPAVLLTMPAADRTTTVNYGLCRTLTTTHSGDGSNPSPVPAQSDGCPAGKFAAGESIALVAAPAADRFVLSWSGTSSDQSRDLSNRLTMPDADLSASVSYGVCRTLTATHSGSGSNPVAVPSQSAGCSTGKYATGEILSLVAAPAANQRVKSWTGATQSPAAGDLVNTLTMPNANKTVTVAYEPCVALIATIEGQGALLQTTPAATYGCDPSSFVTGQTVTLLAAPSSGWHVAGWRGTANDDSTDLTNAIVIGTGAIDMAVIYVENDAPADKKALFMPMLTH